MEFEIKTNSEKESGSKLMLLTADQSPGFHTPGHASVLQEELDRGLV